MGHIRGRHMPGHRAVEERSAEFSFYRRVVACPDFDTLLLEPERGWNRMVIAARKKGNLCGQGAAAKLGWVHGIGNPEGRLGDGALFTFPYFKVHFVCVCVWWVCGTGSSLTWYLPIRLYCISIEQPQGLCLSSSCVLDLQACVTVTFSCVGSCVQSQCLHGFRAGTLSTEPHPKLLKKF